ncbi:carotenoid oxygenase family protein [Congregibacter sp.]|uniref:carotenoid oxygenase family protein n=1 Tax=Congregibacter sp. TaxID=2744308 RepID=UPI003859649B
MNRREFLQGMAAVAALHTIPFVAQAAKLLPWSIGFDGVEEDLPPLAMRVQGQLPAECAGRLYRNGPARYQRGGRRYEHWFDPDGMVQAFDLSPQGVSHRGRFVKTAKLAQENKEGRFLFRGAGTNFEDQLPQRNNEDGNVANINIQPLAGELVALWEAGSAHRIDPQTLETKGVMTFSDELKGVPFSAHPHLDERGDMWNIGSVPFGAKPMLVLYHLSAQGKLLNSRLHHLDFAGYMHDFVLTPRYLIALNSSAVLGEGSSFVGRIHWEASRASQLLIFDRNDLSLAATVEVPPTFVFHFGNGWEEGDTLNFTACEYADSSIVTDGMRRYARQESGPYHNDPELVRYTVSLRSLAARKERLGLAMEFPSYDSRKPFEAQALLGAAGQDKSEANLASAVVRVDPQSGERDSFDYGEGVIVEEPLYVPGAEGGYALHSYLDYAKARSGIAVLRSADLASGPVMTAEMDRVLPLGFHGCFLRS